jgi:Fur family peroxide stress response transcriptional regulator
MNTAIKNAILASFEVPEKHPTAADLYKKIKEENRNITKEAVDSALKVLEKEGAVYSVVSPDNSLHFGKAKGMHAHFICRTCGKVRDIYIKEGALDMIQDHGQSLLGRNGKILRTNISFEGECHDCPK